MIAARCEPTTSAEVTEDDTWETRDRSEPRHRPDIVLGHRRDRRGCAARIACV